MSPIIRFSRDKRLPDNKKKAKKIKLRLAWYVILKDVLYKRGYSLPYLRCLSYDEANYIMREIHNGIYGNHSGVRSLAYKAIRQGYFWPTMKKLICTKICSTVWQMSKVLQHTSSAPRVAHLSY